MKRDPTLCALCLAVLCVLTAAAPLAAQRSTTRQKPVVRSTPAPAPAPRTVKAAADPAVEATHPSLEIINVMQPCCRIVSFDSGTQTVVAREDATGRTFRIQVGQPKALGSGLVASGNASSRYRPGQVVYRDMKGLAVAATSFPIRGEAEQEIGSSSRKMKTAVTVSNNGRIDGRTRTWTSEFARGFTGAVEVAVTDIHGNVLHKVTSPSYGVDPTGKPGGKSDRTESWTATVPAGAIDRTAAVVIHHYHDPKNRMPGAMSWIVDNWECVYELYQTLDSGEDEAGGSTAQYGPVEEGEESEELKELAKACENAFD